MAFFFYSSLFSWSFTDKTTSKNIVFVCLYCFKITISCVKDIILLFNGLVCENIIVYKSVWLCFISYIFTCTKNIIIYLFSCCKWKKFFISFNISKKIILSLYITKKIIEVGILKYIIFYCLVCFHRFVLVFLFILFINSCIFNF